MDVTKLILNLQSKITENAIDQQMVSKAIQQLKLGAVQYVYTYSNLPNPPDRNGDLYLVEGDGLYMSYGGTWVRITQDLYTIWSWGSNSNGSLGHGTAGTCSRSSPVLVIGGITDWCQIAGGSFNGTALRSDGTIWVWGSAGCGRLGDGTTIDKCSPVSVVGGFTDWTQISGIGAHSAALRSDGSIWSWGYNTDGRVGDNTTIDKSSPVSVVGGFTNWSAVSSGNQHSIAIRAGVIWAWGKNDSGLIGDNTTINRSSPVSIVGGFADWCQISAGASNLALRTNGTLWTWGANSGGVLGDGTTINRSSPVSVVGGFTDWCQVSLKTPAGAVRTNGSLWTWGVNGAGQLGDNTTINKSSPVSVVGGFTDWCAVSAAGFSMIGIRTNGTIWSWGCGQSGSLGDNTTINQSSPVSVVGGFTDWCRIGSNGQVFFAIRSANVC